MHYIYDRQARQIGLTSLFLKSRHVWTRRNFKIVCTFVAILTLYYGYQIFNDRIYHVYEHDSYSAPCEIPELDPFDPEMMKYIWRPNPLECFKNPTPVVYVDDNNVLQFNTTALKEQGETEATVQCEYFSIIRSSEELQADMKVDYSNAKPCKLPADIAEDYFRVTCRGSKGKKVFDNTVSKIVKTTRELDKVDLDEDKYNFMLFGIDSMSRSSAIRQLPNTFKYLTEDLQAMDFRGYTKVQDNTYPNIIPLLTGFIAYSNETPKIDYHKEYMDKFPFIWKNFTAKGYATIFAEDLPNLSMFNLEKIGFNTIPTDHYMRPYWLANFKLTPLHNLVTDVQRRLQNRNIKIAPSALCNGNEPNHVTVMNYLKQFMLTYRKERKFLFSFLTELAHSYQNFLNLADNDLYDFFKWMKVNGFLDDTIVVLFSDHGLKYGNNQHLFAARLESRLPYLNILLPEKLKKKYPDLFKNIRTNRNRVASTFDLHATIRDVLHSNYENPTSYFVNNTERGTSLFKGLSKERSCKDANIGESYCACYKSEPINVTNNEAVHQMALQAVVRINTLLKDNPECARLELNNTMSARKVSSGLKSAGVFTRNHLWFNFHVPKAEERDDTKYMLVLTTTPGGGQFYATCSYNSDSRTASVLGNIDRINRYGNQSHCMRIGELRHLCLCNDMVGKDVYR